MAKGLIVQNPKGLLSTSCLLELFGVLPHAFWSPGDKVTGETVRKLHKQHERFIVPAAQVASRNLAIAAGQAASELFLKVITLTPEDRTVTNWLREQLPAHFSLTTHSEG